MSAQICGQNTDEGISVFSKSKMRKIRLIVRKRKTAIRNHLRDDLIVRDSDPAVWFATDRVLSQAQQCICRASI